MKLRELKSTWSLQWVERSGPGDTSAVAEEGVLEGLERLGHRLLLRINVDGRRRTASLLWSPPPAVGDVETVLLASIGARIRDLGDLEVPDTRRSAGRRQSRGRDGGRSDRAVDRFHQLF